MIVLSRSILAAIARHAERTYPEECCGLLVGTRRVTGDIVISRAEAATNVAPLSRGDRFEVDPQVRFNLMRDLRGGGGAEAIVGHYHSHPDRPASPSPTDAAMAYEPDLVWVIIAVRDGVAGTTAAFRFDAGCGRFQPVVLSVI